MNTLTKISHVTLEATDAAAATQFYADAFGPDERIRVRESDAATSGFRGFHLSVIVSQPSSVTEFMKSALAAGATELKPVAKSMWGHGGVVQAPDGAIWKIATSAKKDTEPASRTIDEIVLLLGATDVSASKKFYVDRGLPVGKSFGSYVDFAIPASPIGFGLYKRRALAKDAGVPEEGSGSHRIVIGGGAGAFADPDGFSWE